METKNKIKYTSAYFINKKKSNQITNAKSTHVEKNKDKVDCSDSGNDKIDKKKKQSLTKELNKTKDSAKNDEPWEIEEDSDHSVERPNQKSPNRSKSSKPFDINAHIQKLLDAEKGNGITNIELNASCSLKNFNPFPSYEKKEDTGRKILEPHKQLRLTDFVLETFVKNIKAKNSETEDESNLPAAKKKRPLRFTELLEMHMNPELLKIDSQTNHKIPVTSKPKKSDDDITNPKVNLYQNSDESSSDIPERPIREPVNDFNWITEPHELGWTLFDPCPPNSHLAPSCSKDIFDPSSSKEHAGPSWSTGPFSNCCPYHLTNQRIILKNHDKKLKEKQDQDLSSFIEELEPYQTNQENILAIGECDLIKNLSNGVDLDNGNKPSENNEFFVEDPDIVNPDIMYNINLNEHYKQMDLLVEKISKPYHKVTVLLDEYIQLPPIPQIESEHRVFTAEERQNFADGIPEWEYDIDHDDWNKIMVKRAVVFTAHAGFSIANEESLYVLADVAIDYIKKLAVIMKNNFDIQSKSSCADLIDPINNSLQEIGVKGGVSELIKHYENDVFGRRNKLLKKCHHLQKTLDQFVDFSLLNTDIKAQYTKENSGEENTNKKLIKKKNDITLLKEKRTETEAAKIEGQSMVEEVKINTEATIEEIANTNIEVEPAHIDYTNIDKKIDDAKNFENVRTDFKDKVNDKKINSQKTNKDNQINKTKKFDLLKPLDFTVGSSTVFETSHQVQENEIKKYKLHQIKIVNSKPEDKNEQMFRPSSNFESGLSQKVLDDIKKQLHLKNERLKKEAKEFEEEFERFNAQCLSGNNTSPFLLAYDSPETQSILKSIAARSDAREQEQFNYEAGDDTDDTDEGQASTSTKDYTVTTLPFFNEDIDSQSDSD